MKTLLQYGFIKESSRIGILCNQTAWDFSEKKYRFEMLAASGLLKKIFIPEHGLFGELQDQEKLNSTLAYQKLSDSVEWVSLYHSENASLTATPEQLAGIDLLLIDLQDTGSRYYTFTTTVWLLLKSISERRLPIHIVVYDKPNPAGRKVEGTCLTREFASFIGIEGLPHRHGLTMGELCSYFRHQLKADWKLTVIPPAKKQLPFIPPSPNMPALQTCRLYSGQCLWEGTNVSEARGTTRPFEMFGAPFLDWTYGEKWNDASHPAFDPHVQLRPVSFIPVFHKYCNEPCHGLHVMVIDKKKYHSLSHSLRLIKFIKSRAKEFKWREGPYEAFNDKKAIELLVGDRLILDYFEDKSSWKEVRIKMREEERRWIKETKPFLLYKPVLQQLKFK
jgi:uncharacterized protein YbbC (DUF1343 family)